MPHLARRLLALWSFFVSFAAAAEPPSSGLRVANPHEVTVDATIECAGAARGVSLAGRSVHDFAPDELCDAATLHSRVPLLALETTDAAGEQQRLASPTAATCGVTTMAIPLFACKLGSATVSVPPVHGAAYEWTVDGATIAGGAGTHRVTLALGNEPLVRVSALVTAGDCTKSAAGVLAVREPLVIRNLAGPAAVEAKQPVTLTWSYAPGGEPAAQALSGDGFASPVVLSAAQRSYTFTPRSGGTHKYELHASYAPSIVPAARGRRRSAGSALVGAVCPATRATATVEVRGCRIAPPEIKAPDNVQPDQTFTASVSLQDPNDSVQWSIENATVLGPASGSTIEVRAAASGSVKLAVRVEREAGCAAENSLAVAINPVATCDILPAARVEYVSHTCDRATVRATFTGKPPFSGRWSDGKVFRTYESTLTHEFTRPGTYEIYELRDASCSGGTSTAAELLSFTPRARLSLEGPACGSRKIKVRFTGVPPFSGAWFDGVPFKSDDFEMERTAPSDGTYSILWVTDRICSSASESNRVEVIPVPVARLAVGPYCQYSSGEPANVGVYFNSAPMQAPYTVEWEDGVKSVSSWELVSRPVMTSEPSRTLQVKRAYTALCDAELPNATTTVAYRRSVGINEPLSTYAACVGQTGVGVLQNAVPLGATIEWKLDLGEIVSGQGTREVTFRALTPGRAKLTATATYTDGACGTDSTMQLLFSAEPLVSDFRPSSPTVIATGEVTLQFTKNGSEFFSIGVTPADRASGLGPLSCGATTCSATFTDRRGPGTVSFELQYGNSCTKGYKTATTAVTVVR